MLSFPELKSQGCHCWQSLLRAQAGSGKVSMGILIVSGNRRTFWENKHGMACSPMGLSIPLGLALCWCSWVTVNIRLSSSYALKTMPTLEYWCFTSVVMTLYWGIRIINMRISDWSCTLLFFHLLKENSPVGTRMLSRFPICVCHCEKTHHVRYDSNSQTCPQAEAQRWAEALHWQRHL